MSGTADNLRPPRAGEELDLDRLAPFLREAIPGFEPPLEVQQFPAGYSNLTYCLKSSSGEEVVLRRPPRGAKIKSGHDMSREWRILTALAPVFDRVPTPLAHCTDESIIGAPFYVMQRVQGTILRGAHPAVPDLDDGAMATACHTLIDTLADIHGIDYTAAGLESLGRPAGYVRRQLDGWTARWQKARTFDAPAIEQAIAWLEQRLPPERPGALIHNDYKYDNVVYAPGDYARIVAVLDWELATLGDPLMDLGTSLAYWIEPEDDMMLQAVAGPTARVGNLRRIEVAERYAARTGADLSDLLFYYVFGLFKVAVIGQQIFARYQQGLTSDPRFAALEYLVRSAGDRAAASIARGDIR